MSVRDSPFCVFKMHVLLCSAYPGTGLREGRWGGWLVGDSGSSRNAFRTVWPAGRARIAQPTALRRKRLAARALAAAHASFPSRLLPAAPTADAERSVSSPVEPTREPSGSRV